MGYPVLQPVLQYGERGPRWELQSWFVDARNPNYPVVTAPPIMVSPGDKITSFMRLSEDKQTWTVSGVRVHCSPICIGSSCSPSNVMYGWSAGGFVGRQLDTSHCLR